MAIGKDIKVIIFDFDGTIFHLDVDWIGLKEKIGLSQSSKKTLGDLLEEYVQSGDKNIDIITEAELLAVGDSSLDVGIESALAELQSKGYKLAVLTRNSRVVVEKVLENSKLADNVYIVGREDSLRLKPDPEGLYKIAKHYKTTPNEMVLVGDTFHDIHAAKSASLMSVVVKNPALQFTPKGADLYIENISSLPDLLEKV